MTSEQTAEDDRLPIPAPGGETSDVLARSKSNAAARTAALDCVDAFLKTVGYKNSDEITDPAGWRHIKLGSAAGRVGVVHDDSDLYLVVDAQVMPLPSDKELILPLMRELLEFNVGIPTPARVGIQEDVVVAALVRDLDDLQQSDIPKSIHCVMSLADRLDDALVEKYSGTAKARHRP